jgi:hypothetical protein
MTGGLLHRSVNRPLVWKVHRPNSSYLAICVVEIDCLSNFGHGEAALTARMRHPNHSHSLFHMWIRCPIRFHSWRVWARAMQFLCSCCSFLATRVSRRVRNYYHLRSCRCFGFGARGCWSPSFASQNSCHRRQLRDATTEPGACQMIWLVFVSRCLCRRQFSLAQAFGNGLHNRREGRGCWIHLLFTAFMARYRSAHRHI